MALTRDVKKTIKARVRRDPAFAKALSDEIAQSTGAKWAKGQEVRSHDSNIEITRSSGNIFVDLGFEQPEEELAKAKLAHHIWETVRVRKLTKARAKRLWGWTATKRRFCSMAELETFRVSD